MGAGGGGTPFICAPAETDPAIASRNYWTQHISTAAEALEHLHQNGRPFVEFFSDYPGYQ